MTPHSSIALRDAGRADASFLNELYASTRADELAFLGWDATRRQAFLRGQFAARQEAYARIFPSARHQIVMLGRRPVGALIVSHTEDEIRLVDAALLPKYRRRGIGTLLLGNLIEEAAQAQKPLRLQVLQNNPARRLYLRLGLAPAGNNGDYLQMERLPPKPQ